MKKRLPVFELLAGAVWAVTGIAGCSASAENESIRRSTSAQCAENASVTLQVKPGLSPYLYADSTLSTIIGALDSGVVVTREATRAMDDGHVFSVVDVLTGAQSGRAGWVDTESLVVSDADGLGGSCSNELDADRNASAAERITSTDNPLSLGASNRVLQCVSGFGDGSALEAIDFVNGLKAIAEGTLPLLQEAARRDRDLILSRLGNREAAERLNAALSSDLEKVQAVLALVAHAIPAIHSFLNDQWIFYQDLDDDHKANYVCSVIGRLAVEVVIALASSEVKLGELVGLGASEAEALAAANRIASADADIPLRIGKTGYAFAGRTIEQDWEKVISAREVLLTSQDFDTRLAALDTISYETNVLSKNRLIKEGNCSFSAATTLFILATGGLACPLPQVEPRIPYDTMTGREYTPLEQLYMSEVDGRYIDPIVVRDLPTTASITNLELTARAELEEGQLAWLRSEVGQAAPEGTDGPGTLKTHATLVTKIDGKIVHINNQNWITLHPGEHTLEEWGRVFRSAFGPNPRYRLSPTSYFIPFR